MKDLIAFLIHLLATLAKFLGPGGEKAVVADSLLMKQQLLIISRSRRSKAGETSLTKTCRQNPSLPPDEPREQHGRWRRDHPRKEALQATYWLVPSS